MELGRKDEGSKEEQKESLTSIVESVDGRRARR